MLKCVSLFSGAGGLDLGLSRAGFQTVFANDLSEACRDAYCHESNFGSKAAYYVGSATDVNEELIRSHVPNLPASIDLLAGGPPCPPYSKSRFYRKEKPRGMNDPVGDETMRAYLSLLGELRPRAFLFENVHGFAYKVHSEGLALLTETARRLGYRLSSRIVNAADYGVPQIRMRFIMVGMLDRTFEFPAATHIDPSPRQSLFDVPLPHWVTAGEAIGDLDTEENASDEGHYAGGQFNDLLKQIPPGDNYLYFTEKRGHPNPQFVWRSRYWSFLLKLSPNLPSWTLQARRSNNMGPLHWRNRILRIAEIKRLQTFPDHWFLSGKVEDQWRQVGNAVPPLLAERLGEAIREQLTVESCRQRIAA